MPELDDIQHQLDELEQLYQATPVGLGLLDRELRYVRVNASLAAMNGRPVERHPGTTVGEILPGIAPEVERLCRQVLGTGEPVVGIELRPSAPTAPDEMRYWRMSIHPLFSADGSIGGVGHTLQDITEWKAIEAQLLQEKQFLDSIIESLPGHFFMYDSLLKLRRWNQRSAELTGYSGEEAQGLDLFEAVSPEDREAVARAVETVFREGTATAEYHLLTKDGRRILHTARGARIRIGEEDFLVGLAMDISDRERAEQDRVRLATAVEQSAEAVAIAGPRGEIEYVNAAFEKVTGYGREESLGRHIAFPNEGVSSPETLEEIQRAIDRGERWRGRLVGRRKDGSRIDEECTISAVRDHKGSVSNYVAVARDVTEQLRLEQQFRQAQKLEALGTLAGGIAHDFRNILTPIIGFAQLLLEGIDGPVNEEQQQDLERIITAGSRAQDLIGQILAFSRENERELKPVRLVPLIKETLKLMQATLTTAVEVRQRVGTEDDVILGDPTRVHQILVNLCTNAGLAMEGNPGVLEVALDDLEADAEFVARNPELKEGPYLRLTVTDTGCGMSRDTLERVFEPFFTTRGGEGGTGLGLAAVHGIAKSFGGAVRVYSELGHGSAFHVYLPKAALTEITEAGTEQPVPRGTERILFVDDEEAIAELGRKLLTGLGYQVTTATVPAEALEMFRSRPEEFDLVITDQIMPKITGRSLVHRLRRLRPNFPAVLCTGFSRIISDQEANRLENVEFVSKPTTTRELGEAVRRALDRAGGDSE